MAIEDSVKNIDVRAMDIRAPGTPAAGADLLASTHPHAADQHRPAAARRWPVRAQPGRA